MSECLFCRIAGGEIPATVVRDGPATLAFRDVNPQAPTHVLVIPKAHYENIAEVVAADPDLLAELVREAHAVAVNEGIAEPGYRVVFNTGTDGGQTVLHVHAHVLGGRHMAWPPG